MTSTDAQTRCARNCYQCPECTALLAVTAVPKSEADHGTYLKPEGADARTAEAFLLQCQYCDWSTLDIDLTFTKPTKIAEQLAKYRQARQSSVSAASPDTASEDVKTVSSTPISHDLDTAFANLTAFYKTQLATSRDAQPHLSGPYTTSATASNNTTPYTSPSNLHRIMSLYGNNSLQQKPTAKPQPMREAQDPAEGLFTYTPTQTPSHPFQDPHDLLPRPFSLRTRRGKRCRTCRQILARPETKPPSLRFKIRSPALHHIPRLLLKPLNPPVPAPLPETFRLRVEEKGDRAASLSASEGYKQGTPEMYVLIVRNPIFEPVKITLATPAFAPARAGAGGAGARVTVLCPSFTVGAAGDVWDEALGGTAEGGRGAAMERLVGKGGEGRLPEAGKVWERGRSWAGVVVEIVRGGERSGTKGDGNPQFGNGDGDGEEDEVLEIPVFVRADWTGHSAESTGDGAAGGGDGRDGKHARQEARRTTPERKQQHGGEDSVKIPFELGYWCVLGLEPLRA